MRAVILAGGKGTRLRPYTTVLPKPLMPIGDMPILEVVLRQLKGAGFTHVTMAVSYLAEIIEAVCGDGSRFGLQVSYSRESKALSTAGPLKLVGDLTDTFLAMNGDILTTLDYRDMVRFHRQHKAAATIAVHRRTSKIDYGVLESEDGLNLDGYIEKPSYDFLVSMGIYVMEPDVLNHIQADEPLGIPDLMLRLKEAGKQVVIYDAPCRWLDIGRPSDYEEATKLFENESDVFLPADNG